MGDKLFALARDMVGAWDLVSYTSTTADGVDSNNFGSSAVGRAMFDGDGNFSMMVVRGDLPPFASNSREGGTADENRAVVRGSMAYFGTYAFEDEEALTLEILGATMPNWIGTFQRRLVIMESVDRLELVNPRASAGGKAVIRWTRRTV